MNKTVSSIGAAVEKIVNLAVETPATVAKPQHTPATTVPADTAGVAPSTTTQSAPASEALLKGGSALAGIEALKQLNANGRIDMSTVSSAGEISDETRPTHSGPFGMLGMLADDAQMAPLLRNAAQAGDGGRMLDVIDGQIEAVGLEQLDLERNLPFNAPHPKEIARRLGPSAGAPSGPVAGDVSDALLKELGPFFNTRDGVPIDVNALVMWVLRDSYLQVTEDLRGHAEKVRSYNEQKKAIREHTSELRKLRSALAGVSTEEAGNTRLDGSKMPGAGLGGTGGSGAAVNPHSPDALVAKSEFTAFDRKDGGGVLESYLLETPGAQDRLLQVIPLLTVEELKKLLYALGGTDMEVKSELKSLVIQVVDAMTDEQLLAIAADPILAKHQTGYAQSYGGSRWVTVPTYAEVKATDGDFQAPMTAAVAQARARQQTAPKTTDGTPGPGLDAGKWGEKVDKAVAGALAAQKEAEAAAETTRPHVDPAEQAPALDLDASDGSIDAVGFSSEPPYLRASGERIETVAGLDGEIDHMEELLNTVGDDAQLANVDLQNVLQKQQQFLQQLSNMSKTLHDTMMSIIRNMNA